MTDTGETTGDAPATSGMSADRRGQLEEEIDQLRLRSGKVEGERRLMILGLVGLGVGAVLALVGFIVSLSTDVSTEGILNSLSMLILAVFGLTIAVAGGALFVRYSSSRFLRLWLLRLIYEQRDQTDRIVGSR
jgi:hypothetical protein